MLLWQQNDTHVDNIAVKWGNLELLLNVVIVQALKSNICVYIFIYLSFFYIWLDKLHFFNTICLYTFIINKILVIKSIKKKKKHSKS